MQETNMVAKFLFFLFLSITNAEEIFLPRNGDNFDFIVVGAGAAGAAIAARLAEAGQQVLLLEAGGYPSKHSDIPYLGIGPFDDRYDWNFLSESQKSATLAVKDKKLQVPRGKVLGGSTILNAMMYTRGNRKDYDHWKELGNDGWAFEDVLPYFKKMEDYQVPVEKENESLFGKNGPVTVSIPKYKTSIEKDIFDALKELGHSIRDFNGPSQTGFYSTISTVRNGSRCSTFVAYLKSNKNKNLHIVTDAFVTKIKFDEERRAIGVVFEKNNSTHFVAVKKEIVLSAGANNSPHLLMLSGVGPKDQLTKYKIEVVADLPGVGQNLQDHTTVFGVPISLNQSVGLNFILDFNHNTLGLWEEKKEGPLTVPARVLGLGFFSSKYANPKNNWPDFELAFAQSLPPFPANIKPEYLKPFLPTTAGNLNPVIVLMRPKSVGFMELQSSDPYIPLTFQPNYLEESEDVDILVEGLKASSSVIDTKPFSKLGAKWNLQNIPGCAKHEENLDEYLSCFVRHYTFGLFHQCGTCKMGPKSDKMAVVDPKLRVYKVKGLRVVDASIMPKIITGHTMAPSIMIGEKAADIILGDWKVEHEEL